MTLEARVIAPLFALLLSTCGATACGRVGYELVPGHSVEGGSGSGSGGRDGGNPASGGAPSRDAGDGGAPGAGGTNAGAGGAPLVDASAGGSTALVDSGARDAAEDVTTRVDADVDAGPPRDFCAGIPPLRATPAIDGILEPGLALTDVTPLGWGLGTFPPEAGPPDATARYVIAWDAGGLYFFVSMTDPAVIPADATDPPWMGDGVEFYVDSDGVFTATPNYDDPGARQFTVAAPSMTTESRGQQNVVGATSGWPIPWTNGQFVARRTAAGYDVEAYVTAADLGLASWPLSLGATVGFDLGFNLSFESPAQINQGHRLGQYFSRLASSGYPEPYRNASAFCPAVLGAK